MLYPTEFLPLSPSTCSLAGPEFLGWPLIHLEGQVQADLAPLHEHATIIFQISRFLDLQFIVGDAMRYNHLKYSSLAKEWIQVSTFPKVAFVVYRGIREDFVGPQPPLRSLENKRKSTSNGFTDERHRLKDSNLHAPQILHTQFRMFGTFIPNNVVTMSSEYDLVKAFW